MNAAQRDYLISLGLPIDATAQQEERFAAALSDDQRRLFDALAEDADDDDPLAAAVREMNDDSEPVRISAMNKYATRIRVQDPDQKTRGEREAFIDAVCLRLGVGTSVSRPDGDGCMLASDGRPWQKPPHVEAGSYSGKLHDAVALHLQRVGPPELRRDLSTMGRPALMKLAMSRPRLGKYFPALRNWQPGIALANATGDVPGLLADALGKVASTSFGNARRLWRHFARRGTLVDFKSGQRIVIEDAGHFRDAVAPGDEIDYYGVTEGVSEPIQLLTYRSGLKFTREMLLNDDVDTIGRLVANAGDSAARLEDRLAINVLTSNATMSDGSALFSTAHGNTTTGAINRTNLSTAAAKMANHADAAGNPLDIQPGVLLTPMAAQSEADTFISSATSDRLVMPGRDPLKVVSTAILDADSTSRWYLLADPTRYPALEVAHLRGQDQPTVQRETEFDSDGVKIKIRHDVGVAAVNYRGAVRSSGT